jgi:putative ABC transport system substrate-binding protein
MQAQSLEVRVPGDFGRARQAALDAKADGLIVLGDHFLRSQRAVVISIANSARLPAMYDHPFPYVEFGGLMGYGPNILDLARRGATHLDKIIKGATPADLPIERPSRVEFAINLRTARTLGLALPQSVLEQATQVIQ